MQPQLPSIAGSKPHPRRFIYRAVGQDAALPHPQRRLSDVALAYCPKSGASCAPAALLQFRLHVRVR